MMQSPANWPGGYAYPEAGGYLGEPSEDSKIDLREIIGVLLKRKRLIGIAVASCLALGGLWVFLQKPLYTASIRLQIDKNASTILKNGAEDVERNEDYMGTELELLKGRSLAERVASRLHLGKEAGVQAGSAKERSDRDRAAADSVLGGVSVKPVAGTRLVDILYTDGDPSRAQTTANAYGDAYVASHLDKRFQANAYAKSFLEDQVKQLKLRLEEAEKAMIAFAEKEQIVVTTDKESVAESNLAAANAALGTIIADRMKNEQLWRQAESSGGIDLPQLLTNQAIQELRGRRGQLVAEYQEKSQTFRPNYPEMMQLSGKIKEVEHQIGVEVKTVKSSLKAAYEGALNQENQMKERIEKLRQETLDLQKEASSTTS
ncbi:GumC family protein [Methylocystis sp. IM2]|uniref:GumC family protein n=1 Tax=unclassified Methylocystis TaxID=2625913 RepID=UPI0030FA17FE